MSEARPDPDVPVSASLDRPSGAMRGRALGGVVKTGLSQLARLLVQFGSIFVLSRLLLPSQFGLLAMVAPVIGFAALFQDLGLSQAVVQKDSLTEREVSSLFWIGFAMSLVLAAVLVALSPLVGRFYREPVATALTAAMSVNIVLGGLIAVPGALLSRRMRFGVMAIFEASAAIGGLAVSIGFALLLHDVWALYLGNLASALIPTVGFWAAARWHPSRPARRLEAAGALRFGAGVTGFNVANFFARNLDNVLIGRVWGERPLGLYDRAYKLLLFPLQQISAPISRVMLPVLSQMAGEPARYRAAYVQTLSQMMLVGLPGIAFMVGAAAPLVSFLLGPRWADAAPIFAILGLASLVQIPNNSTGWLFMSQSRTREYMLWGLFSAVTSVASFAAGVPYGPKGVATAYAIGEYLRTPLLWWVVCRRGPLPLPAMIRLVTPYFVGGLISLAAVHVALEFLPARGLVCLAVCLAVSIACSLAWISLFRGGRVAMRDALVLARRPLLRLRLS